MDAKELGAIAGIILSLAFSYTPGLSDWYAKLTRVYKQLVMLGLLVITSGGVLALACFDIMPLMQCDQPGILNLVQTFIAAAMANQATDRLSPDKPE